MAFPEAGKDRIYAVPVERVADFAFDADVARVFPDMLNRSVPGYATMVQTIGALAGQWLQPRSRCYDLGCSLGAVTYAVAGSARADGVEVIAVDNAPAMIERLQARLDTTPPAMPVKLLCMDVLDLPIERASLVVLNLTLQFIAPSQRLDLLKRVHRGLLPGGALLISEKIRFSAPSEQRHMEALHLAYKRAMGYSDLEISQKRQALDRVLVPDTLAEHQIRLRQAGFAQVAEWFRCLNFTSLLAVK